MRKTGNLEQALKKVIQEKRTLRVGFINEATAANGKKYAQVAYDNEYGKARIPPRPFFRKAIKDNKDKWVNAIKTLLKQDNDIDKTLGQVGNMAVGDIVQSIRDYSDIPNSPVTLLLKERFPMNPQDIKQADIYKAVRNVRNGVTPKGQHNNPLVWTGHMMKAVSYEISNDES